jgi:hypothetical protein
MGHTNAGRLGPDTVADLKGRDMGVDRFQELFGVPVAAAD